MNKKKIAGLSLSSIVIILLGCCFLCFIVYITTPPKQAKNDATGPVVDANQSKEVKGESTQKIVQTPTCIQDKLESKTCSTCKMATATYLNKDCSKYSEEIEDTTCINACLKCKQDELVNKTCSSCNKANVTYKNADCTTYSKVVDDSSCSSLCPKAVPIYQAPADTCCKHCTTGKACGDSCISRSYTCHKAPGCACDY